MSPAQPSPLRVAIISRQEVMVRGLVAMLADFPDRAVVTALRHVNGVISGVDVVVYDTLCLHRREGEELDELLAADGVTVLVLSRDMRPDLRERALARGCTAWISMSARAEQLVEGIELAAAGKELPWATDPHGRDGPLTDREAEILALITQGLSNLEITQRLHLTVNTLKTHIRHLYRRIGVTSRSQAVAWALQHGFDPSGEE